jgi:hypothetical protein
MAFGWEGLSAWSASIDATASNEHLFGPAEAQCIAIGHRLLGLKGTDTSPSVQELQSCFAQFRILLIGLFEDRRECLLCTTAVWYLTVFFEQFFGKPERLHIESNRCSSVIIIEYSVE